MSDAETYDVVVIGAGPPGENVAGRVTAGGLSCALVEAELFGGECSYWACMPSKALLRPVELRGAVQRLPGIEAGPLDTAAVLARRDAFTHHHDDSSQLDWVRDTGTVPVRGRGRLAGPRTVAVELADGGTATLTARHAVVLATGTRASVPDLPGLADARPWTSREATNADHVPHRLAVLGGGVVACEMAQAHRGLGAEQVTVIERGPRLLGRLEPFASELLAEAFAAAGIDVRTGVGATGVRRDRPGGEVAVSLDDGSTVTADELLVAVGRTPRTDDLGLDTVGLDPGGYVDTDDTLTVTGVDGAWLYAVGDANGRNLLTHMGKYQARVCGDVVVARARGHEPTPADRSLHATADGYATPAVVFTDPQVASVGLTESAAREAGHEVRVVDHDLGAVAGASLLADDYRGRARLVIDEADRVVLGATFVGQDVAELLHSATVAVTARVPLDLLWHAVPAYPTVSEVWLRLLEDLGC